MFQQFLNRLLFGVRRLMAGRYGTDKLSLTMLGMSLMLSVVSAFLGTSLANLVLTLLSYGLMFWALFRVFSKNSYARYEENRKFLRIFDRLKDYRNCYFNCPKCRQTVRVPRGKGKIAITCPRCKERFIKKT